MYMLCRLKVVRVWYNASLKTSFPIPIQKVKQKKHQKWNETKDNETKTENSRHKPINNNAEKATLF